MTDLASLLSGDKPLAMVDPSQQRMNAARWYDAPLPQALGLQPLGELISGSRYTVPPQEGITQVTGASDPVMFLSGILSPLIKGYLARETGTAIPSMQGMLRSQRGSIPANEGESSMDALKRMFIERGGIESGESKNIASGSTAKQFVEDMKSPGIGKITSQPTIEEQIVKPKSTLEKGLHILDDWNAVTPDILRQDFTKRYGSIDDRTFNKMWDYLIENKVIDPTPGTKMTDYGFHTVNEEALKRLGKK